MATLRAKTKVAASHCCTDSSCKSGLRNRYFLRKPLSPYSFQVEQRYALERRHLLNRAIHGWGVAYGFELTVLSSGSLKIKSGLALDRHGRELLHAEELIRAARELIVLDEDGQISDLEKLSRLGKCDPPYCLLLSAHYAEQDLEPVKVSDPCQCEHLEWNYTCETIRFSLQAKECAECCKRPGCEWQCACGSTGLCDQDDHSRQRGGHCLCEHITQLSPDADCNKLCEIEEPCSSVRVDLHNGVPLACTRLVHVCGEWVFAEIDACAPRRLVKSNDVLFDLIQGCDLTNITEIGWGAWHRQEKPVPFKDFSAAFDNEESSQQPVKKGFWVKFSRPVLGSSLRPECFAITVMSGEREGGWWQPFRVPIVEVKLHPQREQDPPDYVRGATVVVDEAWVQDALRGYRTLFQGGETRVEIEVRGDLVIDCNGQTVDANAAGMAGLPTGNGTPGGTFLSTFRVAQAELVSPSRSGSRPSDNRQEEVS